MYRVSRRHVTPPPKAAPEKEKVPTEVDGLDAEVLACAKKKLPKKLADIHFLFMEMEKVVSMKHSLGQKITYEFVKKNVANNCKRALSDKIFGSILQIYPSSYKIELEKEKTKPGQPPKHNLVLKPNLLDDLAPYYRKEFEPRTPTKTPTKVVLQAVPYGLISPRKNQPAPDFIPKSPSKSPRKTPIKAIIKEIEPDRTIKFEGWRRTVRAAIIKYKLWQYLQEQHDLFLESKKSPKLSPSKFHKDFVPDEITEIVPLPLPKPAQPAKQLSMLDYIQSVPSSTIVKSVEKINKKLASPVKKVRDEVQEKVVKKKTAMSLLERIKAKEAAMETLKAKRDPKLIDRLSVLEELQKNGLTVICSEYQQRTSMEHHALYKRLTVSIGTQLDCFEKMITVLTEIAPDHVTVAVVQSKKYVKLAKNDYNDLIKIVETELSIVKEKLA